MGNLPKNLDPFISVGKAASLLGMSRSNIYKRIEERRIAGAYRIDGSIRFKLSELQRWIQIHAERLC